MSVEWMCDTIHSCKNPKLSLGKSFLKSLLDSYGLLKGAAWNPFKKQTLL